MTLFLSVLGLAFYAWYLAARVHRNEKDIAKYDESVTDSLRRLHEKLDNLPCKNPVWKKETCA